MSVAVYIGGALRGNNDAAQGKASYTAAEKVTVNISQDDDIEATKEKIVVAVNARAREEGWIDAAATGE